MGHAIPTQQPAVVLRSHFDHLRALLAITLVAVVGLTVAVVILANDRVSATRSPWHEAAVPIDVSVNPTLLRRAPDMGCPAEVPCSDALLPRNSIPPPASPMRVAVTASSFISMAEAALGGAGEKRQSPS